jgi:DNA-binding FadR family transcriptional regulator
MGNSQINTFPKPISKTPSLANIIARIRRGENIDHLIVAAKQRQIEMNELLNRILEKNTMIGFQFCIKPLEEDMKVLNNLYNEPRLLDIARSVTWTFIHINSNLHTFTDKDINFLQNIAKKFHNVFYINLYGDIEINYSGVFMRD